MRAAARDAAAVHAGAEREHGVARRASASAIASAPMRASSWPGAARERRGEARARGGDVARLAREHAVQVERRPVSRLPREDPRVTLRRRFPIARLMRRDRGLPRCIERGQVGGRRRRGRRARATSSRSASTSGNTASTNGGAWRSVECRERDDAACGARGQQRPRRRVETDQVDQDVGVECRKPTRLDERRRRPERDDRCSTCERRRRRRRRRRSTRWTRRRARRGRRDERRRRCIVGAREQDDARPHAGGSQRPHQPHAGAERRLAQPLHRATPTGAPTAVARVRRPRPRGATRRGRRGRAAALPSPRTSGRRASVPLRLRRAAHAVAGAFARAGGRAPRRTLRPRESREGVVSSASASEPPSAGTVSHVASVASAARTADSAPSPPSMKSAIAAAAAARLLPGWRASTRAAASRAVAASRRPSAASASACDAGRKRASMPAASRQASSASSRRPSCHSTSPRWKRASVPPAHSRAARRKHCIASSGRRANWWLRPRVIHSA